MSAAPEKGERSLFVLHGEKYLAALRWWLKDRRYNDFYPYLTDCRGNRMVGVNFWQRDEQGRERRTPRGLVLLLDEALADSALKIIQEHMEPR